MYILVHSNGFWEATAYHKFVSTGVVWNLVFDRRRGGRGGTEKSISQEQLLGNSSSCSRMIEYKRQLRKCEPVIKE